MGDQHVEEDAPLDFSIKRTTPTPSPPSCDEIIEEERPGVLRSPELGQTAVPPRPIADNITKVINITPEEKIAEPQPAMPGGLPAFPPMPGLMPSLAAMPGLGSPEPAPKLPINPKGSTRPFKAYPKEPLSLPLGYFGLPGMNPFPTMDNNGQVQQNSEDMFKQYRDYVMRLQQEQAKVGGGLPLDKSPPAHKPESNNTKLPASPTNVSSTSSCSSNDGSSSLPTSPSGPLHPGATTPSSTVSTTTGGAPTSAANKRKRFNSLPDEQKDQAYWERRRKNNDAAKRSRDARRAKEDEIAIRAAFLEQENLKLRVEVTSLKNETAKLRCMLYNS